MINFGATVELVASSSAKKISDKYCSNDLTSVLAAFLILRKGTLSPTCVSLFLPRLYCNE